VLMHLAIDLTVVEKPIPASSKQSEKRASKSFSSCKQMTMIRLGNIINITISMARSVNDDSDMSVSFYLREKDHRARILCKVPRRGSKPSEYFCLPLNLLEILRERSCLRLCRRRRSGTELVLWTLLKFTTMEGQYQYHPTRQTNLSLFTRSVYANFVS
jgi:hypothetical protein